MSVATWYGQSMADCDYLQVGVFVLFRVVEKRGNVFCGVRRVKRL